MNILALPAALAFTMNLILCLVVLSSKPKDIAHRLFACFVISFAAWNIGELIMINSVNPIHAIFGVKVIFIGLTFAPLFFLHFSFVFPFEKKSEWSKGFKLFLLYMIPVALLVTFSLTFRIDIGQFKELRNVFYYGLLFEEPLVFLIFLGLITLFSGMCIYWGIENLIQSLRTTRIPRQKLQIKYLIFGIVAMAIAGTIINLLNYFLKLGWPIFFLASLYSILVSLFFAIALIKYQLLDIHLLIRGGILYSSISGLILAVYILIIKNIGEEISQRAYGRSLIVESAMILALVFMLRPFQRKVGDWIDRFFYMERVRFRTKLSEFSRTLTELVDLDEVGKTTVHFITQTLHVDSVLFFFLKNEANAYRPIFGPPPYDEMKYSSEHPFVKRVEKNGRAVDLEHLKGGEGAVEEIDNLIEKGWMAVTPIFIKERLLGYILLGKKRTEKDYTVEELELLEAFSNQAALAISRALIYRDMSLKDKQIMQAEKMAAIGELAAGIAHEIRNPLGIISGSAETVRKHENQKIREEMTGYILEESTRINRLISTFLDFARPKEPKLVKCDLREVLEKTLLLLSPQAKTQGVEIRKEISQGPFQASVDPDQMRQAFTNLGINALEAMPEGGILKINVLENAQNKVSIRFIDTGNGIPEEAQSKIFDPFFTTKEGGTGLGLSIAHQIVTQHGGNLGVEGGEGKGSIFTIILPLVK
ncbi:MAG TPA: ATP-binding protein [Thermodesulfobacteriota bacterium]|nr:ATP-binding protein [Thermodesulfobacteriota bacterium]